MLLSYDSNVTDMKDIICFSSILSANELRLLLAIFEIREELKSNFGYDREPEFALPQNYFQALWGASPNNIVNCIDKLYKLKIIKQVSNNIGECAMYQFNPRGYEALVEAASKHQCILKTGRAKTPQQVPAAKILSYIIGKSSAKRIKKFQSKE